MLKDYGLEKRDYRSNGIFMPKTNKGEVDADGMFHSVTYEINEIVKQIVINTRFGNTSRYIVDFDKTNDSKLIDIETKYSPTFGRCYGLGFRNHILQQGVSHIDVFARLGIYIYLTHPGQFMHVNSNTKVITHLCICDCTISMLLFLRIFIFLKTL